jgi:hypothetical protein
MYCKYCHELIDNYNFTVKVTDGDFKFFCSPACCYLRALESVHHLVGIKKEKERVLNEKEGLLFADPRDITGEFIITGTFLDHLNLTPDEAVDALVKVSRNSGGDSGI